MPQSLLVGASIMPWRVKCFQSVVVASAHAHTGRRHRAVGQEILAIKTADPAILDPEALQRSFANQHRLRFDVEAVSIVAPGKRRCESVVRYASPS